MNEYSLTPVQEVDGLRIKRDDLYAPFGPGEVNGGKLRQCVMLVNSVKKDYKSLLTYCGIHSPQAPITAAVARANGMPCRIVYGGTTRESVAALPMPRLAMKYGASIVLAARSGRHSILHARAKELAAQENSFIVQYGINIIGYGDTLLTAVAAQTENLPDDIENLVMTCGSGITATGVMIGLHRYGKRVKRMHLVATAPDRRGFIHETLKKYGADREFEYHDLFHSPGFVYEKSAAATWGGIRLHPHYEAKTMQWFRSSGIAPESTLFWITGAEQPGTELKVRRGGQCRIGPKTTFGSVNRAKARRPTRHLPSTETWAQTGAYGSLPNSYPRVTRLSSVGAARKSGENAAERMTTIWMT